LPNLKRMVCGFVFVGEQVVLIRKNRPEWQRDLFNGIGGHVEEDETPLEAMIREFREEAGAWIETWDEFVVLEDVATGNVVHFFAADHDSFPLSSCLPTDELVILTSFMPFSVPIVENLYWLIPLARMRRFYPEMPIRMKEGRLREKRSCSCCIGGLTESGWECDVCKGSGYVYEYVREGEDSNRDSEA